MGYRVGKKVGNTYVSTNGRNVRTTTKVDKNTYVTRQYGHTKYRTTGHASLTIWIISIMSSIFAWNYLTDLLGLDGLQFTLDLLPENVRLLVYTIVFSVLLFPVVMKWVFKHL